VRCEIGADRASDTGPVFVAWALKVRHDGALEPLFDEHGGLYRATAETLPQAVSAIRSRLVARFGAEASDVIGEI
jgi:hypothetical protein